MKPVEDASKAHSRVGGQYTAPAEPIAIGSAGLIGHPMARVAKISTREKPDCPHEIMNRAVNFK